jgi:hypothetical protein
MRKVSVLIIVVIFLFLLANTASALRCGNLFVRTGVKSSDILENCGEPALKEDLGTYGRTGEKKERWTYGPHQGGWYYYLYFRAGVLDKIDSKKQ